MKNSSKKINEEIKIHREDVSFSPSDIKRIKENINKSDTEKFHAFARLMRIHFMLKNAVIIKQ